MLTFTYAAATKLADTLTIQDTLYPGVEGPITYTIQPAPIISDNGAIISYHTNLYVIAANTRYASTLTIL